MVVSGLTVRRHLVQCLAHHKHPCPLLPLSSSEASEVVPTLAWSVLPEFPVGTFLHLASVFRPGASFLSAGTKVL